MSQESLKKKFKLLKSKDSPRHQWDSGIAVRIGSTRIDVQLQEHLADRRKSGPRRTSFERTENVSLDLAIAKALKSSLCTDFWTFLKRQEELVIFKRKRILTCPIRSYSMVGGFTQSALILCQPVFGLVSSRFEQMFSRKVWNKIF